METPLLQRQKRKVKVITHAGSLYPFKGIWYFLYHPFLWPLVKSRFIPCAILSIAVLIPLFMFTYLPQVAFLWIWNGPAAWLNATVLVLSEGAAVVSILFEAFFVDETQVDIFDAVLVNEGHEELVKTRRKVSPEDPGVNPLGRLGPQEKGAVYCPFNLRQILEYVLFLWLYLIPYVGVPLFLILTGYRAGPLQHYRYWKFMGIHHHSKPFVDSHRWKYTMFGSLSLFLQLIPGLNMLFLLTTTAGSALLVVDWENEKRMVIDEDEEAEYGSLLTRPDGVGTQPSI